MESLGNLLKSLSDALNSLQPTQAQTESSHIQSHNFPTAEPETPPDKNDTKAARIKEMKIQALEDDDEDFESKGRRSNRVPGPSTGGSGIAAGVGLAALAIGGVYLANAYFSKEQKLSETQDQIQEKLKKIHEETQEIPVVGFDCQWTLKMDGSKRNKIALLQIASPKGTVLMIQINKLYTFPPELISLLKNRNIIKSGIETLKDARYLLEDYGLVVTGTFDLRFLAEETSHRPLGLAKLAEDVLGIVIDRDWDLVASDWEKSKLDENQLNYAIKAAKASVDIFTTLIPFAIPNVNRNEILSYCSEHIDRDFIFYSQYH